MLTKVIHTTGGSTEFIYEPNEYWVSNTTTAYPKWLLQVLLNPIRQFPHRLLCLLTPERSGLLITIVLTEKTSMLIIVSFISQAQMGFQDFLGNSTLNTPPFESCAWPLSLSIENVGSFYSASATMFWFAETQVAPTMKWEGWDKEIRKYDGNGTLALSRSFEYKKPGTSESNWGLQFYLHISPTMTELFILQNGNHALLHKYILPVDYTEFPALLALTFLPMAAWYYIQMLLHTKKQRRVQVIQNSIPSLA